jgi:hypothetical protein
MRPIKGLGTGRANGKYKNGYCLSKGYVRITAGRNRGKYAHRVVCEELLSSPLSYMLIAWNGKIPKGVTIHHVNYNKTDNTPGNLMFLDKPIHDFLSLRKAELYRQQCEKELNEVPF